MSLRLLHAIAIVAFVVLAYLTRNPYPPSDPREPNE